MSKAVEHKNPKQKPDRFLFLFVSSQDRHTILENLSLLVASGMGVAQAIDTVARDAETKTLRRVLDQVRENVESGVPFWRALGISGIFRESVISLIKIGEETGKLSDNLQLVSLQEEKERTLQSKLRSAMMYPAFVFVLTMSIGTGIAWFILPELARVFSQLHLKLPLITKVLILVGTFLGKYGAIVVPSVIFILLVFIYFLFFFSKTKFIGQTLFFFLPGTRRLIQEIELGRFGYLLGTLLRAGVPITESLDSLVNASFFPQYRKLYEHLARCIQEGESFEASFASYPRVYRLMPQSVARLIVTGERSGNLPETFSKVNATYEAKAEITTKNLSVMLEPVLLVVVWLGVVGVALAVILPIYSLIGQLNAGGQGSSSSIVEESAAPTDSVSSDGAMNAGDDSITRTPTASEETSETDTAVVAPIVQTLTILPTGTGYLNVRSQPSLAGDIIGRVAPGETYEYRSEGGNWFEIIIGENCAKLSSPCTIDGDAGWISGDYATSNIQDEKSIHAP